MHYYQHNISDFRSGTVNMTRQARWIYRDMIDVYYDCEEMLPLDVDILCDKIGVQTDEERAVVERILRFKFEKTAGGYSHDRCEKEITAYHAKAEVARENGKKGGRPVKQNNPAVTESGTNYKLRTKNYKTKDKDIDASPEFEKAWSAYPERGGGNSKQAALKAWRASLNKKISESDMLAGTERYAAFCAATGKTGTEYVKQASTFFGPSQHFAEAWALPNQPAPAGGGAASERMKTSYPRGSDKDLADKMNRARGIPDLPPDDDIPL